MGSTQMLSRNNQTVGVWFPEPVPAELATGYAWPKPIQKLLDASDAVMADLELAKEEWQDAQNFLEESAPLLDAEALRDALLADEPDPGQKVTATAHRAEQVAWAKLEIARDKAVEPARAAQEAVQAHIANNLSDLAAYEISVIEAAKQAHQEVLEAQARAEAAARRVGTNYVHARWFAGETFQPEQFTLGLNAHDRYDDQNVRALYERMITGDAAPSQPGELGTFGTVQTRRGVLQG